MGKNDKSYFYEKDKKCQEPKNAVEIIVNFKDCYQDAFQALKNRSASNFQQVTGKIAIIFPSLSFHSLIASGVRRSFASSPFSSKNSFASFESST